MSIRVFVSCDPRDHSREERLLTSVPGVTFDAVYSTGSNSNMISSCQYFIFSISLKSLHTSSCYQEFETAKSALGLDKILVTIMELGLKPNFIFPATHQIWSILADPARGGYGGVFKRVFVFI